MYSPKHLHQKGVRSQDSKSTEKFQKWQQAVLATRMEREEERHLLSLYPKSCFSQLLHEFSSPVRVCHQHMDFL